MLRPPGAGHSRKLLPPLGPKGQGEKAVVTELRESYRLRGGCSFREGLLRGSSSPRDTETRRE